MSDVSGIPNMGFGGGNFFAPQFSYNPQMSAGQASAAYMPAENYAQNVTNNLFSSGGGFGRQTDYYSQQVANSYGNINAGAGLQPVGTFSDYNAGGAWPSSGGGASSYASPYQTSSDVWNNGASSFQGGGGSSGLGGSIYGGGGPTIDWSGVGNAAAGMGGGRQDPYPNMSMPGGLNSSFSSPSGASPIDWGNLFDAGRARTDPSPGMSMPGGLGSPMSTPQQQSGINWGNVGAAAGGSAPYTSGIAPDQSGGQTFAGGTAASDPFPGMAMPGGLGSPMTAPEPGAGFGERFDALGGSAPAEPHTYDFKPMFEGGGGGGFGSGGTESQTFGGNAGSLGGNPFSYIQDPNAAKDTPGPSAEALAEQARARLAEAMAKPQVPITDESAPPAASFDERFKGDATAQGAGSDLGNAPAMPDMQKLLGYTPDKFTPERPAIDWSTFPSPANDYEKFQGGGGTAGPSPFDQPSLEEFQKGSPAADAARPPDKIDTSMGGRKEALDTLRKELSASGLVMTSSYRDPSDPLSQANPRSAHTQALAFDTRARTPEQADAAISKIKELMSARGMVEGRDYKILDEVRSPSGHATGPHIHTTLTPEGMQQYQQSAYDVGAPRPPADIPYPQGIPLPQARPEEAPGTPFGPPAPSDESINAPRPPMDIPSGTPFVNDGTPFGPPAPPDYKPPAAAPVKHSGLELARANIDTPIEKIAMERGGQKAVDQINSMAMGQTPRQLMQSYGGMFMNRAEPLFSSLGITRSDFEKAITMPQTKQDLKMRFGEGGDFGPYPAYAGPEAALGGGFPDFRQSTNIEDRRGMPDAPLGVPGGMPSSQDLLGYTPQQWAAEDYPASFSERFGGDAAAPETSMADFQSPANGYGSFQGAASPENRLEAQRAAFAAGIRDNPEKSLQLAARLYSEDQNSSASRQAILEAMLNAQQASGRDPFDPDYYPKNTKQYRDALAKLSSNNDLLDRIYQEMETPFSGSNRSNYATDWASAKTAADERRYTTSTWTSPSNEQFFRKDISNDWTGLGRAAQNQKWYQTTSGRAR